MFIWEVIYVDVFKQNCLSDDYVYNWELIGEWKNDISIYANRKILNAYNSVSILNKIYKIIVGY